MAIFNGRAADIETNKNKFSFFDIDNPDFDQDRCYPNFTALMDATDPIWDAMQNIGGVTEKVVDEKIAVAIGDIEDVIGDAVGMGETAIGTTIEISADDQIYITDITVDTDNNPDITFTGNNLLDNSLFLDEAQWKTTGSSIYAFAYNFDLPAGTYTFSTGKKTTTLHKQYIYFQISSDDFVTKTSTHIINAKVWVNDSITFTLQEGEKARIWRSYNYSEQETRQLISDIMCDVMLQKGDTRTPYVPYYEPFSLPYEAVKNLRIPAFDKYAMITNSEDANMQVAYAVGGSLYDYIEKSSMDEAYAWIGDGDGETDYTEKIQNKIDEVKTLGGGTVYLGNGTYNISNFLLLTSHIRIVGTGKTIINQTADNTHAVVWSGSHIGMQNLTIKLSGACTELTGCIYVNCNNTNNNTGFDVRDETYPSNSQTNNCFLQNVILQGRYKATKDSDGIYSLSEEMQNYLGCGLYANKMYFEYADFSNIEVTNLYAGIYGGGGANKYNLYSTYCRYTVYGGDRNNMFDITGQSGKYASSDGTYFGITDYICYVTGRYNIFNVRAFDTQYNTTGQIMYFSPLSFRNTYDIGAPAGATWSGAASLTQDYGSVNKNLGDLKLVPFAMGQRLKNIMGETEFKYADGATSNVLAGAGIWGNISSNVEWDETHLPLKDVCRYPKDNFFYNNEPAYALSKTAPSADNPFEIVIDLKDRPIVSNGGVWIQFHYLYVAQAFTVAFLKNDGSEITGHTHQATNNRQTLWTVVPTPRGNEKIYKIKITFTKALQIPDLTWKDDSNSTKTTDYNPNGLIGIINIGAVHNELYGRAYLGECGGSLYGNVDMHGNTLKNLPTPTEDGDAIPKSYLDGQLGDIETALDKIIEIQNELMGSTETITFTINDDTTCTAEEGMTWGEWVDSEYNTINAQVDEDGAVAFEFEAEDGEMYYAIICTVYDYSYTRVQSTDTIIANGLYYTE